MKKTFQIVLIGLLTLSCNNKKKTEPKPFKAIELELLNCSEEDRIKETEYLKTNIFYGLENRNDGFDSESIHYFSEPDFEIILDRIEKNRIGIYGIEPWLNGGFYDVLGFEEFNTVPTDPNWYRKAFLEFKKSGEKLLYSASYRIPKKLLKE